MADELNLHEDDAHELVIASSDAQSLPDDPYFFPSGLGPFHCAKRLYFYRRHTGITALEELFAALADERVATVPSKRDFLCKLVSDTLVGSTGNYFWLPRIYAPPMPAARHPRCP